MTTKPQTTDTIAKIEQLPDSTMVYLRTFRGVPELPDTHITIADLKSICAELLALRRLVEQAKRCVFCESLVNPEEGYYVSGDETQTRSTCMRCWLDMSLRDEDESKYNCPHCGDDCELINQ